MKKTSQYTELDKILNKETLISPYDKGFQKALPFEEYEIRNDIEDKYKEEYNKKLKKEREEGGEASLQYPNLSPENIKFRGLNEKELERLKKDDESDLEYKKKYHWNFDQSNHEPRNKEYYEINKMLPEEAKAKILEQYKKLQETSKIFYQKYKEANELASKEVSLNYNLTYFEFFRNFPHFILESMYKEIGILFGTVPYQRYKNSSISFAVSADALIEFFRTFNIFNINPLNFQQKIYQMEGAIVAMNSIMDEYDKKAKLIKKLPKIEKDVEAFLRKTEVRRFLKWMDEYFPNDKEDFFKSVIDEFLNENYYHVDRDITLGRIKNIKTYISIYESTKRKVTNDLYEKAKSMTFLTIKERLENEVERRFVSRFKKVYDELENLLQSLNLNDDNDIDSEAFNKLIKVIYKYSNLDLRPIFQFVYNQIKAQHLEGEDGKIQPITDTDLLLINRTFIRFKKEFMGDIINRSKYILKENKHEKYISDYVDGIVNGFINKYYDSETKKFSKDLDSLNEQDIEKLAIKAIESVILKSLPRFSQETFGDNPLYGLPSFTGLGKIIGKTGKFSTDSILNFVHSRVPFVPKEFILHLVKSLFKTSGTRINANEVFKILSNIDPLCMKIFLAILKKNNKLNPDSFTNEFINYFNFLSKTVDKLEKEFKAKHTDDDVINIMTSAIRSFDTFDKDRTNLENFMMFIHNSASGIPRKDFVNLFLNKNFSQYDKIGIVKKMFKAYAVIKNIGGIQGISTKFGNLLKELKESGYVSKNFESNIKFILKVFNSNEVINPSVDVFKKLFIVTSEIESDLDTLEMGEALKELISKASPKDKRLFDLNLEITPNLRFRVLKDKDPRILRIGIETDCCQRIGGAGAISARDSFVNPLAGVVILEHKDEEGKWNLLSQSYFHYVPKDNGFILDNVEDNDQNVKNSRVDMEAAYAYLAQQIKSKFDAKYFLAGKAYSDIETSAFRTYKLKGGDPRYFDKNALTENRRSFYTDFESSNAMDLSNPNFKEKRILQLLGKDQETEKKAFEMNMRRIIFASSPC